MLENPGINLGIYRRKIATISALKNIDHILYIQNIHGNILLFRWVMYSNILIKLTADIVSAHVSYSNVVARDLPGLISNVYAALDNVSNPVPNVVENVQPYVSIRSSVKPGSITCIDCGKKMKTLKRHIGVMHNMSVEAYRRKWGLTADYPLVAPEYATLRKDLAAKIGLGRKPRAAK